jgi:hypothetical protein
MIRVFVLHCFESSLSASKPRPAEFSRDALWQRLCVSVSKEPSLDLVPVLDESKRAGRHHICEAHPSVLRIQGGSGSRAFAALLELWSTLGAEWKDKDVIVLLEDDYAVKGPWVRAVLDGLRCGSYVTLYDHPDKYSPLYTGTPSQIHSGRVCHWRTTPSTTNSFATRWGTLRQDLVHHARFSSPEIPAVQDHARWLHLWSLGRSLVSSLPGLWSHEEEGMQSPLFHSESEEQYRS